MVILGPAYSDIDYNQSSGIYDLEKDGKKGLADASGRILIPAEYDELLKNNSWNNNIFPVLVKKGTWYYYLDRNGNPLPYKAAEINAY